MGINSTSPQVAGDVIVAAAEAICGTAAATASEANHIEVYSDDATTACSATDVTIPTTPTHVDIHAPPENTTREETGRIGEAEKYRITIGIPLKSSEAQNYPYAELPRIIMHQPVMRTQRQFRTKTSTGDIILKTISYGNSKKFHSIASTLRRGGGNPCIKKKKRLSRPRCVPSSIPKLHPAHGRNSSTYRHLQRHGIYRQNSAFAYILAGNKLEKHPKNKETTSNEPLGIV
jgi:hypothetical protein